MSSFLRVNGKSDNKNKESRQIIGWRDDNDDCRYVVAPFFLLPAAMLPGGVFPTSFVAFSCLVYNDSSRRNTSRVCVGTVLYVLCLVYSLSSPIQPPTEILLNSSSLSPPPACRAVSCLRPSSVFFSFRAREAWKSSELRRKPYWRVRHYSGDGQITWNHSIFTLLLATKRRKDIKRKSWGVGRKCPIPQAINPAHVKLFLPCLRKRSCFCPPFHDDDNELFSA